MANDLIGWSEVLAQFGALGGVFENLELSYAAGRRGLVVVDPARPFRIFVPRSLFVARENIELCHDTLSIKGNSSCREVGTFFRAYHRTTSWNGGRQDAEEFLRELSGLPTQLKGLIAEDFEWACLVEEPGPDRILDLFLDRRLFHVDGHRVFAPIMELLNHDENGPPFSVRQGGLLLEGYAAAEVLVRYSRVDAWQKFVQYGFVSSGRYAFSRSLSIQAGRDDLFINIQSDFERRKPIPGGQFEPVITVEGGAITLSFALLGDREDPDHPGQVFCHSVEPYLGKSSEQVFATILNINRIKYHRLVGACGSLRGRMVDMIREAAQLQLDAMSPSHR